MSNYVLSADLSPNRSEDCYTILDTDTNTIVYVGNDMEQVRKYKFISVTVDEQDKDLLFAHTNQDTKEDK